MYRVLTVTIHGEGKKMGTSNRWKDNHCTRCGKDVSHLTRIEQDAHEVECLKQKRIFE